MTAVSADPSWRSTRATTRNKPVIVVKSGRAPGGARAAASHTGALAGALSNPQKACCNGRCGDTWYLDEVFCKINDELVYLWRAVDQDGQTLDVLMQKRRNGKAAKRFFRKLLKGLTYVPTFNRHG